MRNIIIIVLLIMISMTVSFCMENKLTGNAKEKCTPEKIIENTKGYISYRGAKLILYMSEEHIEKILDDNCAVVGRTEEGFMDLFRRRKFPDWFLESKGIKE